MRNMIRDHQMVILAGAVFFTLTALASPAKANMTVSPMIQSLDTKKTSATQLRVHSKSDTTQYVKVSVKRVLNPATDQETEVDAPRTGNEAVMVSPSKFALPAGGSRLVRVIALSAPVVEQLYRVQFEPVAAPSDEAPARNEDISGQVEFSLIWAPLVRVMPRSPSPLIAVSRDVFTNTGNVRLGLLEAAACDSDKANSKCDWLPIERSVYPGQSLKLPHSAPGRAWRFKYRLEGVSDVQQFSVQGGSDEVSGA